MYDVREKLELLLLAPCFTAIPVMSPPWLFVGAGAAATTTVSSLAVAGKFSSIFPEALRLESAARYTRGGVQVPFVALSLRIPCYSLSP